MKIESNHSPNYNNFCLDDSIFWEPIKIEKDSAWVGHIPFAHWIVEKIYPKIIVELGTHSGVSFSAFCNSVIRNGLNTKCYAIDTWEGDEHAGYYEERIFEELKKFNFENFGNFSTLIKSTFDEASTTFENGTIDLLHIDGFHSYEAVSHDFFTWLPKLSEKAIVLFHDITEKGEGFGVWRFWEEIVTQYPNFHFDHCHGLGVLQVGKNEIKEIEVLFSNNKDNALATRNLFSSIGDRWEQLRINKILETQFHSEIEMIKDDLNAYQEEILNNSEEKISKVHNQLASEREENALIIGNKEKEINILYNNIWLFNTQVQSLENDSLWRYLRKHPRLKRSLTKYISYIRKLCKGKLKQERRRFKEAKNASKIIKESTLFDAVWYRQKYFDVIYSGFSPEMHYALFGKDGRPTSLKFDATKYLQQYQDVYNSSFLPLVHYELYGKNENRQIFECQDIDTSKIQINPASTLFLKIDEETLYENWLEKVEKLHLEQLPRVCYNVTEEDNNSTNSEDLEDPYFSIILPTYNTYPKFLRECIDSVLNQTFTNWQLCIADDASTQQSTIHILNKYKKLDTRINLVLRSQNGHISEASNSALAQAKGKYIVLLDHDDVLAPTALQEILLAIKDKPDTEIIYSDEDKLSKTGKRINPFFKPDFSLDLLLSQNYICHLTTYKKELVDKIGGFRIGYEGSQDYDLILRAIANVRSIDNIVHIPRILYHWRMAKNSTASGHSKKNYATDAALKSIQNYLDDQCTNAKVSLIEDGRYRVNWPMGDKPPLVSLIIGTRDGYIDLKTCIDSILRKTTYKNFEIIIVDNQSTDKDTLSYFEQIKQLPNIRVITYDKPFNYSAINNLGVSLANGEIIGLINNDIEIITDEWLTEMVSHSLRKDIGCVGAKLLYPDHTIQHAGVVLGIGGVAGHSHKNKKEDFEGYFSKLRITHNVSAVTGAALIVRKSIFDEVGGLDEDYLTVAFNDIDLCLKVQKAGYRNIWTPFAVLIHHESKSRGHDNTPEKQARFMNEVITMKDRWGDILIKDPFYNPHLTLDKEDYSIINPM